MTSRSAAHHRTRTRGLGRLAALAGVVVVGLTGCVRLDVDTRLGEDDTVSVNAIVAFDPSVSGDVADLIGMTPDQVVEMLLDSEELASLDAEFPDAVAVSDYDDGELVGYDISIDAIPLTALQDAGSVLPLPFPVPLTITREGDEFVVTLALSDLPLDDLGVPGGLTGVGGLGGLGDGGLDLLATQVDVQIGFSFPGLVTSANAGEVDGKTVTLGVADLISGQDIELRGSAESAIFWDPYLRWGGIALASLVIIGGAVALLARDRRARSRTSLPAPQQTTSTLGTVVEPPPTDHTS